jgi:hypothetical protein
VVVLEDENIAEKLCQKLNNALLQSNHIQVNLHQDTCPIKIQKRANPFNKVTDTFTKKYKAILPKESCKSFKMLKLISSIKSLAQMNSTSDNSTGSSDNSKKCIN